MEEAIQKELNQLCHNILSKSNTGSAEELLQTVRLLEEKLILIQYFQYREQQSAPKPQPGDYDREVEEALKAAELSQKQTQQQAGQSHHPEKTSTQPRPKSPSEQGTAPSATAEAAQAASQKPLRNTGRIKGDEGR
ncbi:MAG: hypothetical protein U5L96_19660 [Owenweeksia sp.]|nr:hypothetical protein [Owenweeksia sp.]